MKKRWALIVFYVVALHLALLPSTGRAAPASPGDSARVFLLDTLSLEGARGVDSLRAAAAPRAETPVAVAPGEEDAPALAGTPEGQGSISGKVISEARGTAVPDARVIVAGQNLSVNTDADGRFAFPGLPPGVYSLFLYHASYAPLTADSLRVVAGRDVSRRLPLPDKAVQGEAVRVTGSATQASDAGMLFARKNSPTVSDGISSEQISKSPDADAAAALKRVTGISIAGDGLVYVRGLGERYVNMQLNGLNVSSPNPEKRVVPLDMFPTRLLENLTVSKTFTADQPAEFAGGSLQLRTKDYPEKRLLEFSAGAGYEPGSTFENYLTYKGGSLDWLGVDDGTRALPGVVPKGYFDESSDNLGATPEERRASQQRILAALPNVWTPYAKTSLPNQSYGLTMGNEIPVGDDGETVGWLLGANYGLKAGFDEEQVGRIRIEGADSAVYRDRSVNEISTESVQWGVLGTVTWQPDPGHKLRTNLLVNRDWEDEVTRVFGASEGESDTSLVFELANSQQTLVNAQLEGEHLLNPDGLKLTWIAALTGASRLEPDRRTSKYFVMRPEDPFYDPEFPFFVGATQGLQDRFWFELRERGGGGKADLEVPVDWNWTEEGSKLRGGVYGFHKSRDYGVRRISYQPGGALTGSDLIYGNTYEDYFSQFDGEVDSGYVHTKNEKEKDDYSVTDLQWATHLQGDWVLSETWRFIAGFRLMGATVTGHAQSDPGALAPDERAEASCSATRCTFNFGYDQIAVLPAVSAVYAVSENQNARAAYTRTFSFPEYREMAPLLFYSYQNQEEVVGNVDLKPTDIHNLDARWEWFPSATELLAISGFYKRFNDPVELRIGLAGSNNRASYVNVSSANLWGLESELRVAAERFVEALSAFEVSTNLTFIHSEVDGQRKRAMQGQSPYLVNAILFFEPFDGATQMSLLYNRFGRRLAKVGVGNFPDVFEEARESLEYSWTQKFTPRFKTKFTARNLTDAEVVQTQGGLVTKRARPGLSFSLGATYAF